MRAFHRRVDESCYSIVCHSEELPAPCAIIKRAKYMISYTRTRVAIPTHVGPRIDQYSEREATQQAQL